MTTIDATSSSALAEALAAERAQLAAAENQVRALEAALDEQHAALVAAASASNASANPPSGERVLALARRVAAERSVLAQLVARREKTVHAHVQQSRCGFQIQIQKNSKSDSLVWLTHWRSAAGCDCLLQ